MRQAATFPLEDDYGHVSRKAKTCKASRQAYRSPRCMQHSIQLARVLFWTFDQPLYRPMHTWFSLHACRIRARLHAHQYTGPQLRLSHQESSERFSITLSHLA